MQKQSKRSTTRRVLALAVLLTFNSGVEAWSTNQKSLSSSSRPNQAFIGKPLNPIASPQSPSESQTKQKMLKNPANVGRVKNSSRRKDTKLSGSVLASCDTLPSFKTAHGLLSPETVLRLEDMNYRNEAISLFLRTYRQQGPLACQQLLSDPDVLPHLTRAMRDIALL